MKYILIENNTAKEIIPGYNPVFPGVPAQDRYAPDFLAQCVAVPDETEVEQNWEYDPVTGLFAEPVPEVIEEPEEPEEEAGE